MWVVPPDHPLRQFFAGLTEHTFLQTLGIGDPPLVDYMTDLLARFIHMSAVYRLRGADGQRLAEVADMVYQAETVPGGRTQRELHRHIGDFTLFWTGLFPEALQKMRSPLTKDFFIDYCAQGKRSYYIASTFEGEPFQSEAPVLRRLSQDFELWAYGLHQVRREWQQRPSAAGDVLKGWLQQ
ncbi:MAG: hypothetical protein L0Z62_30275 [Gemmataceae bacterium]|nr:hypothetical protein [Gemmataceae bacterium]